MRHPGLRDLLERLVVDRDFLAAFQSDPAGALVPFDLTDRQRALLREGGDGAGVRLAEAFGEAPAPTPPQDSGPTNLPTPPSAPGSSGLAIRLLARLMFSVAGTDAGQAQLHYAATLHVLPDDADPAAVPSPDLAPDVLPGDRLNDALFELKVLPHLTRTEAGAFQVTCLHAAVPVAVEALPAGTGPANADPLQPLLDTVRTAPPGERQNALRALVAALDTDAPHG